ncbi:MAG: hypothetical protein QXX20_04580 [Candidatus Thermoplasmatota archaeon]
MKERGRALLSEKECIERDEKLRLHTQGTLKSITRWVNTHEDGISEWLKNTRRAYFPDRANVPQSQWVAVLLLQDKTSDTQSRIGLLDVGGIDEEDLEKWSVWQDPEASERAATCKRIEETQGNGGKAYMYNLFHGPAMLLGVRSNIKNCKGFIGPSDSEERGIPGYIPNRQEGKNAKVDFWNELTNILEKYGVTFHDLPEKVKNVLNERKSFTLVEGISPKRYEAAIPYNDLLVKIVRTPQALQPLEQLDVFVIHNGQLLIGGRPIKIDPLPPRIGFEHPRVIEIPESLPDEKGELQSTTCGGTKAKGKLILYTSQKDLAGRLKHRWNITYKTTCENIGSLCVAEILPVGVPASQFIYADIILDALSPDYVKLGRDRPNPGPLLEAINLFASEKIIQMAGEINEQRRQLLDEEELDELQKENKVLDTWKNKIYSEITEGSATGLFGNGSVGDNGEAKGGKKRTKKPDQEKVPLGEMPVKIELCWEKSKLIIGRGVKFHLSSLVKPIAKDINNNTISNVSFKWYSDNSRIANFSLFSDEIEGVSKGKCNIHLNIENTDIRTTIPVEIWEVDHVLLTPRKIEIPLGTRRQLIAEVTNDEGQRSTDVILDWTHDALNQLIVRIRPTGWITGNRLGNTIVYAGAGNIRARIGAEVIVVPNPNLKNKAEGFPTLLLTDKDIDPETGKIRPGDPDKPPLWQELEDFQNNIWWLNLQNPQVAFYYNLGTKTEYWRMYHAEKLIDMVVQALMVNEFTQKDNGEEGKIWSDHKLVMDDFIKQTIQTMWEKIIEYIEKGASVFK